MFVFCKAVVSLNYGFLSFTCLDFFLNLPDAYNCCILLYVP